MHPDDFLNDFKFSQDAALDNILINSRQFGKIRCSRKVRGLVIFFAFPGCIFALKYHHFQHFISQSNYIMPNRNLQNRWSRHVKYSKFRTKHFSWPPKYSFRAKFYICSWILFNKMCAFLRALLLRVRKVMQMLVDWNISHISRNQIGPHAFCRNGENCVRSWWSGRDIDQLWSQVSPFWQKRYGFQRTVHD